MIKTVEELKELIEWAKKARVKSLKVHGVEVELSDYAFIEQLNDAPEVVAAASDVSVAPKTPDWTAGTPAEDSKAEEEDLFWSTRS